VLLVCGTGTSLLAAPLPRPRPVVPYLPLPPQMEAAIRDSEEFLERQVKNQDRFVAEAYREKFDDGTIVKTSAYVRREFFLEQIRSFSFYLDPDKGPKDFCGEPRSKLLEKALRQRLELYKMRLLQGILDGSVAKEDWVGPDRRRR
jgi:hypothetical protein